MNFVIILFLIIFKVLSLLYVGVVINVSPQQRVTTESFQKYCKTRNYMLMQVPDFIGSAFDPQEVLQSLLSAIMKEMHLTPLSWKLFPLPSNTVKKFQYFWHSVIKHFLLFFLNL